MSTESSRRRLLGRAAATTSSPLAGGPQGSVRADRAPVVLVHGFSDTGRTRWWDRLRSHLRADGYDDADIHTLSFGERVGQAHDSPQAYGEEIAAELEAIHDERGCRADIVAHSMGGLGSRWALEELDAATYARNLVTLGTPHQGTRAAHLASRTPGGRDMVPGSDFLTTLNDDATAPGVDYTSLWSSIDPLVVSQRRGDLPEAIRADGDESQSVGRRGHLQLVFDSDVYAQYRDRLLGT